MTNLQIKDYIYSLGDTAARLHDLEFRLYRNNNADNLIEDLAKLFELVRDNQEAKDLIAKLGSDTRTDIREVSASLVNYLWKYWKYLPYDSDARRQYDKDVKACARELSWTFPIIEKFIGDRGQWPVVISLYNIWDMEHAKPSEIARLRNAVLKICDHKSVEVRRAIVRTLTDYYESDDDALHILDKQALQFYINATYDPEAKIRDYSLFTLWVSVENLNDDVGKAFVVAFDRESPESEARVEAAIGMARMGLQYERLLPMIMENLSNEGCGTGWMDAADQVHSGEMLLGLIGLYELLLSSNVEDSRLEKVEQVVADWND